MATSEPLVPNDLPYGERQAFVEAARSGGVSLTNPAGPDAAWKVPPPSRLAAVQPGIIPPNYDVFANRQPSPTPEAAVTPTDIYRQRLLEHPNPVYRDIARRVFT